MYDLLYWLIVNLFLIWKSNKILSVNDILELRKSLNLNETNGCDNILIKVTQIYDKSIDVPLERVF